MSSILTLTDANWQATIGSKPALILFSDGDGLRGDFSTAFKKAAAENRNVIFAEMNPKQNPEAAAYFEVGDKPIMIAYYKDVILVRRQRPWGSDVTLTLEMLEKAYREDQPATPSKVVAMPTAVAKDGAVAASGKPFVVTSMTFEEEVINYSNKLPVLVDFWAEWCGPCRQVAPIMEKLAKDFAGQLRIAKIDTDQNQDLAQALRIMSIPTIMAFKQGKLVFNQAGAFPEAAFRDLVQQLIALQIPPDPVTPQANQQN